MQTVRYASHQMLNIAPAGVVAVKVAGVPTKAIHFGTTQMILKFAISVTGMAATGSALIAPPRKNKARSSALGFRVTMQLLCCNFYHNDTTTVRAVPSTATAADYRAIPDCGGAGAVAE